MIIYEDGNFQTNSQYPDTLYDSNAKYMIPDYDNLAVEYMQKVGAGYTPHITSDEDGNIIDITYSDENLIKQDTLIQINILKQQLSDSDYKIIKCYEASLEHRDIMPYDVDALIAERDAIRQQINDLEATL